MTRSLAWRWSDVSQVELMSSILTCRLCEEEAMKALWDMETHLNNLEYSSYPWRWKGDILYTLNEFKNRRKHNHTVHTCIQEYMHTCTHAYDMHVCADARMHISTQLGAHFRHPQNSNFFVTISREKWIQVLSPKAWQFFCVFSRMRSEGSRFTWGSGGEAAFAKSCRKALHIGECCRKASEKSVKWTRGVALILAFAEEVSAWAICVAAAILAFAAGVSGGGICVREECRERKRASKIVK